VFWSTDEDFAREGDSRTLVLDQKGRWAGLVWGGNVAQTFTYVTCAEVVSAEVEAMTGWKVSV
jgi:hypothetical protein